MKTFAANPRVRGFTSNDNAERYKLHKKIRAKEINCKIFARSRTILIPIETEEVDPMLMELSKLYGYKIQTEAFT
ncbi:hypothetical protein PFY12_14675 [Chryseobacterium camelliae]|uniref:Uncharacterized protein n=1 Tax=Chryseobacterium camelliae TaxID=1265445 RepID=A0ABY7QKR8_9FLAO|nr:hypothetical protein [Chryseobacterium camelliae]WBV60270.1 hypothetical protein PFY12_14675 [Chryseobacterium camelliae]